MGRTFAVIGVLCIAMSLGLFPIAAHAGPSGTIDVCIGGPDSCSSEGTCDPGTLSDGITAPTAVFSFCYDPDTPSGSNEGTLTFVVTNTSEDGGDSCGSQKKTKHAQIFASYFNAESIVTDISISSVTDGDGIDRTGDFTLDFSNPRSIMVDGLGLYSVCIEGPRIRAADATAFSGGGVKGPVTFVLDVEGPSASLTTSSFTTVQSTSSNGQVLSVAVAKFQSGGCEGDFSAFVNDGTCDSSCDDPPSITCPSETVMFDCDGPGGTIVDFDVSASSPCYDANELTITCEPFEPGDLVPAGTNVIVTCTVTDPAGRTAECDFRLKVWDFTAPEIFCPDDFTVECNTAGGAIVDYEVTTDDICCPNEVDLICEPPPGSFFAVGCTTVECTAIDWDNLESSCSFKITVVDTTGPDILCPDDITVDCNNATVTFEVTATDICDGGAVMVTCDPPSGTTFPVGTTKVTCTATDSTGNMSECCFNVTVTDDPPTITCPDDITAECAGDMTIVEFEVTADDDCSDPTIVCIPPSGSGFPLGTTTVTCTATDSSGQTAECSFDVTVEDTTDPEITCPTDITLECVGPDGTPVEFEVTATDVCGDVMISCTAESGDTFPCGTTTVECTATDEAGNTAMCAFDVIITDTVAPTINCPEDIFVEGSDKPVTVDFEVTATDLCDPDVDVFCDPPSGSIFHPGTTTVICVATDDKGNQDMCEFEVTVQMYVNFDEDENGTEITDFTFITDEYEPLGVQIDGLSDTGNPGVLGRTTGAPGSTREDLLPSTPPIYVQTWSGGQDSDSGIITFRFFDPVTGTPTTSSFVQMTFLDIESSGQGPGGANRSRLKAFDADGNLLDRVLIPFGGNGNQFVATIGEPGGPMQIASADAVIGLPDDSGGVDEFCYLPNLAPLTVRLVGPPEVYAGETMNVQLFVRNNGPEDLDVVYKVRGTSRLTKPGRTIDGPMSMIVPGNFSSMANPETISVFIRGDRDRFWNRRGYLIVSYKDPATGYFIGMATYEFTIRPPRSGG